MVAATEDWQAPIGEEGMAKAKRAERLQIMLTPEELSAVDDWRFKLRMPSRAAAVRELLRRGLETEGFLVASRGARSESFGVLKNSENRGARKSSSQTSDSD